MKWMICVALLLAGCAKDYGVASTGPWTDMYNEPQMPPFLMLYAFVVKAQGCGHFFGREEGYDAERAAFLKRIPMNLHRLPEKRKSCWPNIPGSTAVKAIIAEVWGRLRLRLTCLQYLFVICSVLSEFERMWSRCWKALSSMRLLDLEPQAMSAAALSLNPADVLHRAFRLSNFCGCRAM